MTYKIYKLVNSLTNQPFYVGRTRKSLSERLSGHISASKNPRCFVQFYIKHLISNNISISIELIRETDNMNDEKVEIQNYFESHNILNAVYIKHYENPNNKTKKYDYLDGMKNTIVINKSFSNVGNYYLTVPSNDLTLKLFLPENKYINLPEDIKALYSRFN